ANVANAASIGAIRKAWLALQAVIGIKGSVAVGVGTAAVGPTYLSSRSQQAKQRKEDMKNEVEGQAAINISLKKLREEIEHVGEVANRDAFEESKLQDLMSKVIALAPEMEEELHGATDSVENFLEVMESIPNADFNIAPLEDQLANLEDLE